jgi:NAD(P)H-hydrate epimerase
MKFYTENIIEIPSVNSTQMKEIDRIAIEETGPNLYQMMENAGRNLAELSIRTLERNQDNKILVLAGTGGNGGGGLCAARHLSNRGYNVSVVISDREKLKDVTQYQLKILKQTSTQIVSFEDLKNSDFDLIVDSILGYSLKGDPKGNVLKLIEWINGQLAIAISLDVPSGIDATTGIKSKYFVKPDITLTLALPKSGFLTENTNELYLADIGIPHGVYERLNISVPQNYFKKIP